MLQTIFRLPRDKSGKKDSSTLNEKNSSTLNEDESSLVAGAGLEPSILELSIIVYHYSNHTNSGQK